MNKRIAMVVSAIVVGATALYGQNQNDTTLVKSPIKWESQMEPTKKGEDKQTYYAVVDGERFVSNKSSVERYNKIRRIGGIPCVVKVVNRKSKATRIVTL